MLSANLAKTLINKFAKICCTSTQIWYQMKAYIYYTLLLYDFKKMFDNTQVVSELI